VGLLVLGVEIGVVRAPGLEPAPKDFKQTLAEATQGAGVALSFLALLLVINLGPRTNGQAAGGPQMHGVPQHFVALKANTNLVDLPRLKADRSGPGHALQVGRVLKPFGVATHFAQQSRGQLLARTGKRAKQGALGMLPEEGLDLPPVFVQLVLQGVEHLGQADGQERLGRGDGGAAAKLAGILEGFHPLGGGFRTPQLLGVQKLFPAAGAGGGQFFRRGELEDKVPAGGARPIIKGCQRRRIILAEGLLKLIDQGGPLLAEADFIAAQQLDLLGQRVHRLKGLPLLAVDAQRVGQRPGIEMVGLVAAGSLALPIAPGAVRIDRIDRAAPLQELVHSRALAGFDGHGHGGIVLDPAAKLVPTLQGVWKAKLGDDLPLAVHDDYIRVIAGPIEAGVVRDFIP